MIIYSFLFCFLNNNKSTNRIDLHMKEKQKCSNLTKIFRENRILI